MSKFIASEPYILYVIVILLTCLDVALFPMGSPISDMAWMMAVSALIVLPVLVVRRFHPKDGGMLSLDFGRSDLGIALLILIVLAIPIAVGNHIVRTSIQGFAFSFEWSNYDRLGQPLWMEIPIQIFCIALPEEFFYRGYLQKTFLKRFEKWGRMAPVYAILMTSALFAFSHFPAGGSARLLTFFPGLLFGFLGWKTQKLIAPILCHAFCNLCMIVLNVHYL